MKQNLLKVVKVLPNHCNHINTPAFYKALYSIFYFFIAQKMEKQLIGKHIGFPAAMFTLAGVLMVAMPAPALA